MQRYQAARRGRVAEQVEVGWWEDCGPVGLVRVGRQGGREGRVVASLCDSNDIVVGCDRSEWHLDAESLAWPLLIPSLRDVPRPLALVALRSLVGRRVPPPVGSISPPS